MLREMSLLDKLERRFGVIGIPGLPRILVGFAALVFGLAWLLPGYISMLTLDPTSDRFWVDPRRTRPMPRALAQKMLETSGFVGAQAVELGDGFVAVIARRA